VGGTSLNMSNSADKAQSSPESVEVIERHRKSERFSSLFLHFCPLLTWQKTGITGFALMPCLSAFSSIAPSIAMAQRGGERALSRLSVLFHSHMRKMTRKVVKAGGEKDRWLSQR
jgi:hypothetical protein